MALQNYSYVVDGAIAGCKFPEDSDAAVDTVAKEGFKTIVNLTEHAHPRASDFTARGVRAVHIPVEDFKAPTLAQMNEFAALVADPNNRPVLVHCRAGIGRTGTMLAVGVAALQSSQAGGGGGASIAPDEVIRAVRARRPGSLEVPLQEGAVRDYCAHISS